MGDTVEKRLDDFTEHYSKRLLTEEFLVDFLGGLVPGVLFLVSAVVALIPPFQAIWSALRPVVERKSLGYFISILFKNIKDTPSAIWIMVSLGGLLFAFVVGHLFYRHDPKTADRSSFLRVAQKDGFFWYVVKYILLRKVNRFYLWLYPKPENGDFKITEQSIISLRSEGIQDGVLKKLEAITNQKAVSKKEFITLLENAVGKKLNDNIEPLVLKYATRRLSQKLSGSPRSFTERTQRKHDFGSDEEDNCEFPYLHYDLYLEHRGLDHLRKFIVWATKNQKRSKTYINLIKVRLRFYYPEKCGAIIRNEAHVRLASSTWYVAKALCYISFVGLSISFSALLVSGTTWPEAVAWNLPALISPLLVLASSLFAWWTILGFLHYQRLREVFFVLETAFTAFKGKYHLLSPPFELTTNDESTELDANLGDILEGDL